MSEQKRVKDYLNYFGTKGFVRIIDTDDDYLTIKPQQFGLNLSFYKSGNISKSDLNGENISHAAAYEILNAEYRISLETERVYTVAHGGRESSITKAYWAFEDYIDDVLKSAEGDDSEYPEIETTITFRERIRRENEQAAATAKTMGYPDLTGTRKQIAWAVSIRDKMISRLKANYSDKEEFLPPFLKDYDRETAKYWIENRDYYRYVAGDFIRFVEQQAAG